MAFILDAVRSARKGRDKPHNEQRGEITSSFFVVLYVAISIPVIGVGVAAQVFGLQTAGVAFSAIVAILALLALIILLIRPEHLGGQSGT